MTPTSIAPQTFPRLLIGDLDSPLWARSMDAGFGVVLQIMRDASQRAASLDDCFASLRLEG